MGGLRRWTISPYPGRQALSRGDYELPARTPLLPQIALDRLRTPGAKETLRRTWLDENWHCPLALPVKGEGRGFRSNFFEEIRPEDVQAFIVGVRIEQPCSRRDTAQERIAVLWSEAKARDLMPIAHGERRD